MGGTWRPYQADALLSTEKTSAIFIGSSLNGKLPTTATSPKIRSQKRPSPISTERKWWLLASFALIITAYALYFLLGSPPGNPIVKARMLSTPFGWFHVIGGLLAMGTGPFQFHKGLRKRNPQAHRIVGRIYAASVIASAIGGFRISFHSLAYQIGRYGFAILAVLWFLSCGLAMLSIWKGDIRSHRDWMARNYALTYAAVMQRWQILLFIYLGMSSAAAVTVTGFSCWIPNLFFIEWWLKHDPQSF